MEKRLYTLRDYVYGLSSGTIARLCGSTKYVVIEQAWGKVMENIINRGIGDSRDWTPEQVVALFKEVA